MYPPVQSILGMDWKSTSYPYGRAVEYEPETPQAVDTLMGTEEEERQVKATSMYLAFNSSSSLHSEAFVPHQ